MKDFVKRLTIELEPLIADLPEKSRTLELKKEELENVSRFLAYVNGEVHLVGIYANQEIIFNSFDALHTNKEEYKASCYLLESEDNNVRNLPQYKKACDYIMNIIDYFKECKVRLIEEINELEAVCKEKKLEKKYYNILSSDNPYISDTEEFTKFLSEHEINDTDEIEILMYIISNNVLNYNEKRS